MTTCMGCGNRTFDSKLDECSTPGCPYNPAAEGEEFEAEQQYDESLHQEPTEEAPELPPPHGPGGHGEADEGDGDDGDDEGEGLPEGAPDESGEQNNEVGESDKLDISQENLPDTDDLEGDFEDDGEDRAPDEQKPEQQLTEEDKGEDPSDEAEDLPRDTPPPPDLDDDDLPPRPQGCNGNCQPGDPGQDGDPCPHCTAKQFKQEMEGEKDQLDEGDLERDWQEFLDEWQNEAEEGEQQRQERDERLEEREPPDLDGDDDDLPPRPPGCNGDCQPSENYDEDADPCPHCTAKNFRDEMREDMENGGEPPDAEELAEHFQDFLKDWAEQQDQHKIEQRDEGEQKPPEEQDEDPPEDEMQDAPEQNEDEDEQKKGIEKEDESDEFKRMAKQMTVTQEKRFDNLAERLGKKVEQMFGQTAEDIFQMAKQQGQFQGEEVSQSVQITSRGVTYWVTISASKEL